MKYYLANDGTIKSFADLINGDRKVAAKVYNKKEFTKQLIKIADERRYVFNNKGDNQVGPAVRIGSVFFAAIKKFLERQIYVTSNTTQVLKMYHENDPLFIAILENKDEHRFVMTWNFASYNTYKEAHSKDNIIEHGIDEKEFIDIFNEVSYNIGKFVIYKNNAIGDMSDILLDSLFDYLRDHADLSTIKLYIFPFVTVAVTIENSEPMFYFIE